VCPNCGRRLVPFLATRAARLLIATVILVVGIGSLLWVRHNNQEKGKREVNSYIACIENGGDNTTCTQLGK